METKNDLVWLCLEAATESKESIETWRRQRRTLESMPNQLSQSLLHRLLQRKLLNPSLLEVFQYSVEEIDLKNENVDALVDSCPFVRIASFSWFGLGMIGLKCCILILGMETLKELDLSRCVKVNDAGIKHLLSVPNLKKLCISETGVTENGVALLSSLVNLSKLDLGGLPVTDRALSSLQVLTKLEYLDLWGSNISNKGAVVLQKFPNLNYLNLAWTNVTIFARLPSITCLNMSNCTIESVMEGDCGVKTPLKELLIHGAAVLYVHEVFSNIEKSQLSLLDVSNSSVHDFRFLDRMDALIHLNVSFCKIEDDAMELVAEVGGNLRTLNLSNTKVSSAGIGALAGLVPKLETLLLSGTMVNDVALSYVSMMPALRVIDLSCTNIKGFISRAGQEEDEVLSLSELQSLNHLEKLDLEETHIKDEALQPLSKLQGLKTLCLKSDFLTHMSLHSIASLRNLRFLGIRGAVLTNDGLCMFNPPPTLETLDLRGCWLLTEDTISLFCETHPQIILKHECAQICSAVANSGDHSSPQRLTSKTSPLKPKKSKWSPSPPSIFRKEGFVVDQRLKYRREELLEMQHSPLSQPFPSVVLPQMLME
ncbi:hypothetical protein C5167_027432 [Papaver somniferum]|nr:hypothetical protein C5167_027432 [Papaver somniferum]